MTDPDGRATAYSYFKDDATQQISYPSSTNTPTTSFTYGTNYPRLATMADGTGTTTYTYRGISTSGTLVDEGTLYKIEGPVVGATKYTINLRWDQLGRPNMRYEDSSAATRNFDYDTTYRMSAETNTLGYFQYNYVGNTGRLDNVSYGTTSTATKYQISAYTYLANSGDNRMSSIANKTTAGSALSTFDYTYAVNGNIKTWQQNNTARTAPINFALGYDAADQLTSAVGTNTTTLAVEKDFGYRYDGNGNRVLEQADGVATSATANVFNQLTTVGGTSGLSTLFRGKLNEAGSVTLGGVSANTDPAGNFAVWADVSAGTHTLPLVATDSTGNMTSKTVSLTVSAPAARTLTYDKTGNLLDDGVKQYEWDAAGRLITITQGTNVTQFIYDGLGRRVSEALNGTVLKRWVWCGAEICEERNAAGTITKRFFPQGMATISGGTATKYFYRRDHLGSIREMVDASGTPKAIYEYDMYGRRSANLVTTSPVEADFGFTGHYYHASSGLHLALYRAYDAELGRWLSRDPIGEGGGRNLYGYVSNNPVSLWDLLGLIEGSLNNLAKRQAINDIAKNEDGSPDWAKDVAKGPMKKGTYKCSQFVFDVTREAVARLPLIGGGFPLAGALAEPDRSLKDWRVLNPGETPQPGDVGAYELQGGGSDYTGHTGINTDVGDISAHSNRVGPPDSQFSANPNTTWRRYIGE